MSACLAACSPSAPEASAPLPQTPAAQAGRDAAAPGEPPVPQPPSGGRPVDDAASVEAPGPGGDAGAAADGNTPAPADAAAGVGQARSFLFKASDADPMASKQLGDQQAFVGGSQSALGILVVHLHGSGEKTTCGYADHGRLLASWGFHVFMPCYDATVTWRDQACGSAGVGNCRLEMLDGVDHDSHLTIAPPESIEVRITRALAHLGALDPAGGWSAFLEDGHPRWPSIIISGQSFGATSSLLIAQHRPVLRAVALSGPLDGGAAWLRAPSLTPLDRLYAFTHVNDGQHPTHKASLAALTLAGPLVEVETSTPPYQNSHRLVGAQTTYAGARIDGHNATEARPQSPRAPQGHWLYQPVWRYLYGLPAE